MEHVKRMLPRSAAELASAAEVAKLIAGRYRDRQPCLFLRYGDTSGRIIARPMPQTPEYQYLKSYLGSAVTPENIGFLAGKIEDSVRAADIVGLRSDLLGPDMTDEILHAVDSEILERLVARYPIRCYERTRLRPDDARRLAQTRKAMESAALPERAMLTDAWAHVSLAENGFLSALMRESESFSVVTSAERRGVLKQVVAAFRHRVRSFECPSYPWIERQWGGDHAFLWERWVSLVSGIRPAYPAEPLLISAGIWTKAIGLEWAKHGGIALDVGSVMDYLDNSPTRPAVLATRYGTPQAVPDALSLERQLRRSESLADFL